MTAWARIFAIFLPMAAIGTIGHELGHIGTARALGYETELHYGSMHWRGEGDNGARDAVLVSTGGPASNMLIGTIGLLWLVRLRAKAPRDAPLGAAGWGATILALFWSRQVFNAAGSVAFVLAGKGRTRSGDESWLAEAWEISEWLTLGIPCLLGLGVCGVVIAFHPRGQRLALAIAGPAGCLAGFALWYGLIGPRLLP